MILGLQRTCGGDGRRAGSRGSAPTRLAEVRLLRVDEARPRHEPAGRCDVASHVSRARGQSRASRPRRAMSARPNVGRNGWNTTAMGASAVGPGFAAPARATGSCRRRGARPAAAGPWPASSPRRRRRTCARGVPAAAARARAGRARLLEEVAKAEVLALLGVRQGDDAARGRVEVRSRRARGPAVPCLSRARPSMARGRIRPRPSEATGPLPRGGATPSAATRRARGGV